MYCGQKTGVTNSRHNKKTNKVWRRRKCSSCYSIFTTREEVEPLGSLVVDSGGHTEPFSRDKLFLSIYDSLKHRQTALIDSTALTDTVWGKIQNHIVNASIKRDGLIQICYEALLRFDSVAAVHYLAFHRLEY